MLQFGSSNKGVQHFFCGINFVNHAVPHRSNGLHALGRAPHQLLRFVSDGLDLIRGGINRHNAGLVDHNLTELFDVNKGGRRPQINSKIRRD